MLVSWNLPLIACVKGWLFGVTVHGIIADVHDENHDTIVSLKPGKKPSGIRELQKWVRNQCSGPMPDSLLSKHVFQVNLQMYALDQERKRTDRFVTGSQAVIVYGSPSDPHAEVFTS